jgi:hypothetical protein
MDFQSRGSPASNVNDYVELDQLPNAYRTVLVLCYLRRLSRDEAAASLVGPLVL